MIAVNVTKTVKKGWNEQLWDGVYLFFGLAFFDDFAFSLNATHNPTQYSKSFFDLNPSGWI